MKANGQHLARLARLESPRGTLGTKRLGCVRMPRILPLEEWETRAVPLQAALSNATRIGVVDEPKQKATALDRPVWR